MECNNKLKLGFIWDVESKHSDEIVVESVKNLVPVEGMNHILEAILKSGATQPNWYIALFEGNYTPTATITAATFTVAATECVAYAETARVAWVPGAVANGTVDNSAAPAMFTFAADKTIYGAALISESTKGGGIGVILSIVRFSSPRINPESLSVKAGLALINT